MEYLLKEQARILSALRDQKSKKKELSTAHIISQMVCYILVTMSACLSGVLAWSLLCLALGYKLHRDFMANYRTFSKHSVYVPLAKLLDTAVYLLTVFAVVTKTVLRPGLLAKSGITYETQPIVYGILV